MQRCGGRQGPVGFRQGHGRGQRPGRQVDGQGKIQLTRDAWANVIDQLEARWGAYQRSLLTQNRNTWRTISRMKKKPPGGAWTSMRRLPAQAPVRRRVGGESHGAGPRRHGTGEQRAGIDRRRGCGLWRPATPRPSPRKVAIEQQKMQIEVDYLERVHEVKLRLFDLESSQQAMAYELEMKRLGYNADLIGQRIAEYSQQREQIRQAQQESNDAAIQAAARTRPSGRGR